MDAIIVQSNVGDSKQAVENNGSQITDLTVQPLDENLKMDIATRKKKKKRKSKKAIVKDEGQSLDQNNIDTRLTNNTAEGNLIMEKLKTKDEVQTMGQTKMDTGPIENLAEGNVTGKRKKKRKIIARAEIEDGVQREVDARNLAKGNRTTKKPKIKDEVQNIGPTKMDIGSTENPAKGNVNIENQKIHDETQSMYQTNLDNGQSQCFITEIVAGKTKKKKKRKNKATLVDDVQKEMDARSTENRDEGNVTINKPKVEDELQSLGPTQMNTEPTENLADGKVIIENPKTQDEVQSMEQNRMDMCRPAENLAQGNATGKRKKKRKKNKAKVNDEVHSEMDTRSTENLAEGNATLNNPETKDTVQSVAQAQMDTGSTENVAEGNVTIENPKVQDEILSKDQAKMDTGPAQNFAEGNVTVKRKKKPKKKKKAKVNDEFSGRMDAGSTENLTEVNVNIRIPETRGEVQSVALKVMDAGSTENLTKRSVTFEIPKVQDEIQSIDQAKMDTGTVKRKKKPKKKKAKVEDELSGRMDAGSTENLAEVNVNIRIPETRGEVQSVALKVMDAGSTENLTKGSLTFENPKIKDEGQSMDKVKMDTGTAKDFTEEHATGKRKKKRGSTRKAKIVGEFLNVSQGGAMLNLHLSEGHPNLLIGEKVMSLNGLSQVSNEIILDEGIGHTEGRSAISTCDAFTGKDAKVLCHRTAPFASVRRNLLVLDINGLLADIVFPAPKHCKGDIKVYGRAVFRRPFCDDFLKFCFQNFYVGIWSSRTKKIIDIVVSYLLGDQKDKLLFCWDMTHSTKTGFKTLENRHKPLVCKELRKIWEQDDPSWPWKKGDYNESNTLLLDDSPYKALLNPLHTAIFPHPYQYSDKNDNSLGPGGDLRVYLEGLATSENVQKYVEEHPFGQRHISEQNLSWEFYDRVINQMSNAVNDKTLRSVVEA